MASKFDLSVRVTVAGVIAFATVPLFGQTPDRTNLPMAPSPFRGDITRAYRTSTQQPVEPWGAPNARRGAVSGAFPFRGTLEKLELRSGPLPQLSESQQKLEEQYAERIAALKD